MTLVVRSESASKRVVDHTVHSDAARAHDGLAAMGRDQFKETEGQLIGCTSVDEERDPEGGFEKKDENEGLCGMEAPAADGGILR